jgi:hypothetical protein
VASRVCESVEAHGRVSGAELRSDERYDSQGGVSMTGLSWDHVVSDPIRADRHRALSNVFEELALAGVLNVRVCVCPCICTCA